MKQATREIKQTASESEVSINQSLLFHILSARRFDKVKKKSILQKISSKPLLHITVHSDMAKQWEENKIAHDGNIFVLRFFLHINFDAHYLLTEYSAPIDMFDGWNE